MVKFGLENKSNNQEQICKYQRPGLVESCKDSLPVIPQMWFVSGQTAQVSESAGGNPWKTT
jgi:hypothetical protein